MPHLTKEQVFQAAMELNPEERAEVLERLRAELAAPLELSEEQTQIILAEIEAHRRDPSTAISRDELIAKMRAAL